MHFEAVVRPHTWWRHQMETFSALLAICAVNSPVPGEFPTQRPVTRSFDVYFDLRPNKRLSKQSWGWWFETQSRPLWRHRIEQFVLLLSHPWKQKPQYSAMPLKCGQFSPKSSQKTSHSSPTSYGVFLWIKVLMCILSQSLKWCMQYHVDIGPRKNRTRLY